MRHGPGCIVVLFAGAMGCGTEPAPEPIGEMLMRGVGGWCDGGCDHAELRGDGDTLQLLEQGDATFGRWTHAGEVEYVAAAAEAASGPQDDPAWSCTATDGVDAEVTLTHEGSTWTVQYCASHPPQHLTRMHALLTANIESLQSCTADEWTEPDC